MKALEKIKEITAFLENCGIDDAHKESEIIVTHCLGIDKTALYRDNPVLSEKNIKDVDVVLRRCAQREPLQYILGYVEFYGLKIKVGKGVLIPRPETELLAEEVIKQFTVHSSQFTVLDLCTGSGCLALAIAKRFPDAEVYGTDISKDAIRYANENARLNDIRNVTFLKGSLFEPLKQLVTRHPSPVTFNMIVSNPPYIRSSDIANLQPEIKKWEPRNALDGGEDGLNYYRTILSEARKYLMLNGVVFLEIGEGQAAEVSEIAMQNGFRNISVIKDYAGIERIVTVRAL
ncbi:MAG: protein-(glutamine-N5) methyltransferase, release factor-specific [Nitrospirae bacterium GWF2_44_13]|nr:MAG: protein-(glutamine-N5) methyltransferase, release factor-specific [Nitrospirae bacterium GWF2_44_13]OGW34421.1 MAG: protein-(glutamine-N5) methyltransferase, release factor-specific [Nitrospirae bacterium GWD2_44_7]OGW65941.1 MAG: protein-(glutamine-N5) methyltransferase, release factor-specific [Nitrospirae bacterium RIFOXYA2_FULL_44_9]OGW72572.1 MAG: protein-(glutamine-N5) methyltransferase, release factor-specific [Nitrospirae bacterium RIFOXYC2_FULL_44_7]HBG93021.1 peptide chain rel